MWTRIFIADARPERPAAAKKLHAQGMCFVTVGAKKFSPQLFKKREWGFGLAQEFFDAIDQSIHREWLSDVVIHT